MAKKKREQLTEEEKRLAKQLVYPDDKATEKNLKKKVVVKPLKKKKKRKGSDDSDVSEEVKDAKKLEKRLMKQRNLQSKKAKRKPALWTGKNLKELNEIRKKLPKGKSLSKEDKEKALKLLKKATEGKYKGPKERLFTPTTEQRLRDILGKDAKVKRLEKPSAKPSTKPKVTSKKTSPKPPTKLPEKKVPIVAKPKSKAPVRTEKPKNQQGETSSPNYSFLTEDPVVKQAQKPKRIMPQFKQTSPVKTPPSKPLKKTYGQKQQDKDDTTIKQRIGNKVAADADRGSLQDEFLNAADTAKDAGKRALNPLNRGKGVNIDETSVPGSGRSTKVKTPGFNTSADFKPNDIGGPGNIKVNDIDLNTLKGLTALQRAKLGVDEMQFQNALKNQINQANKSAGQFDEGIKEGINKISKVAGQDNQLVNELLADSRGHIARAEGYMQNKIKDYNDKIEKTFKTIEKSQNQLESVMRQGIDPTRYFKRLDTAQAIMMAVSVGLGGTASAIMGQEDLTYKMINDSLDRDVKAQVQETRSQSKVLSNRINLFKARLKGYQDEREAVIETVADLGAAAVQKMKMVAEMQPTREMQIKVLNLAQNVKEGYDKKVLDLYGLNLDEIEYQYGKITGAKEQAFNVAKQNQDTQFKVAKQNQENLNKRYDRAADIGLKEMEEEGRNKRARYKGQVTLSTAQANINKSLTETKSSLEATRKEKVAQLKSQERRDLEKIISSESKARDERRYKYRKMNRETYMDLKRHEFDKIKFEKELELDSKRFGLDKYYKEMSLLLNERRTESVEKRVDNLASQWEKDFDRKTQEFAITQDRLAREFRADQNKELAEYSRKVNFDKEKIKLRREQLAEQKRKNDQTIKTNWANWKLNRDKLKQQIKEGYWKKKGKEVDLYKKRERSFLDEYGNKNLVQFNKSASGERPKVEGIFKDHKALLKYTEDRDKNATGIELLNGMYKNVNLLLGNSTFDYLNNVISSRMPYGKQRIKNLFAELLSFTEGAVGAFRKRIAGGGMTSDQDMIRIKKELTGIKEEFDAGLISQALMEKKLVASANLIRKKVVSAARDRNKLIKTYYRGKDGKDLTPFLIKIRKRKNGKEFISNSDVNRLIGSGPKVVK